MNEATDLIWKIIEIIAMVIAAILWGLKMQSIKTRSDDENKAEHKTMNTLINEQEAHIEFQDGKIQDFLVKLDRISQQITQFGVFDLKIKQLENENTERKEENKLIMRKLDGIFNKMNQIELTMSNKANRP